MENDEILVDPRKSKKSIETTKNTQDPKRTKCIQDNKGTQWNKDVQDTQDTQNTQDTQKDISLKKDNKLLKLSDINKKVKNIKKTRNIPLPLFRSMEISEWNGKNVSSYIDVLSSEEVYYADILNSLLNIDDSKYQTLDIVEKEYLLFKTKEISSGAQEFLIEVTCPECQTETKKTIKTKDVLSGFDFKELEQNQIYIPDSVSKSIDSIKLGYLPSFIEEQGYISILFTMADSIVINKEEYKIDDYSDLDDYLKSLEPSDYTKIFEYIYEYLITYTESSVVCVKCSNSINIPISDIIMSPQFIENM